MKKIILTLSAAAFLLASCSKTDLSSTMSTNNNTVAAKSAKPESCSFGQTQFNLTKRANVMDGVPLKAPRGGSGSGGGSTSGVILLDFDGQYVTNTSWNFNGPLTLAPANLTSAQISSIFNRVSYDYAPFNIIVTTDEAVYTAAPAAKRIRVILTESYEWYGQAGGTSFLNSFTWGDNTPCFVFTSLLAYNEKYIGEAAAHEAGHTLGLRHQSYYSGTTQTNAYNYGAGTGEVSWAPIMGCGYSKNLSVWHNGACDQGYNVYQDDIAIIAAVVGLKTDDFSNTTSGAATLTTALNGTINNNTDVDFFSVNLSAAKTLNVVPFNVGAANDGADEDLVIKVYNSRGQLQFTANDPATLSASTVLNAGQYYIAITTEANANAGTYGMLGQYTISLN